MATIGELLNILERQARELRRTEQDAVATHVAGWMALSRMTGRVVALLPLGGHSDHVKAGVLNVLAPLARGPRQAGIQSDPAPQLADLALTMGAISDSLAGVLRWGPRPEQVGLPALGLEASLLSAVHVAARWSLSTMEDERLSVARPSIVASLGDLVVVTQPYALIPPERRASLFEDQAFRAPSAPGLEGAIAGWADVASAILDDRYRVSGWAMQNIAADLGLISQATRLAFVGVQTGRSREGISAMYVSTALEHSARAWRKAAAWPTHIRLGGQNPDLRDASRNLREAFSGDALTLVSQARRVLDLALPIGVAHARAMADLVRSHELWIHAPYLVPRIAYTPGWIREPRWSTEGRLLVSAALEGQNALDRALVALGVARNSPHAPSERPRWAPVPVLGSPGPCGPQTDVRADRERGPSLSP